jgi:RepB DNA-primase from phage plasmid
MSSSAALEMLTAFASVGATAFDVTLLDIEGREQGFQSNRSFEELRRSMAKRLEAAERSQHSIVIRPRSPTATLIQLDDFDEGKAERLAPHSFLTIRTSPGNFQVWLAVTDAPAEKEAAKQFKTRVRRGAGADHSATGATRIAGSLNFKTKYAPAFPRVEITRTNAGSVTTIAALENAGFIAPEQPQPPASVPPQKSQPARKAAGQGTAPRHWPDYQQTLNGAPRKKDGTPDRSRADFMWCKWAIQRGHNIEDTAAKLAEVSARAQESIAVKGDYSYPFLTACKAAEAVDREKAHRPTMKSSVSPR